MATEFNRHFGEIARVRHEDGSYPCETVRTIMWTLKMKPLEREWWECDLDKSQKIRLL